MECHVRKVRCEGFIFIWFDGAFRGFFFGGCAACATQCVCLVAKVIEKTCIYCGGHLMNLRSLFVGIACSGHN